MNIQKLSNFSVLKSFTDTKQDILECLLPFVEYAIVQIGTEYQETTDIKEKILESCGIDIPLLTLKTLLKKLKRSDLITDYERTSRILVVKNFTIFSNEYTMCLQNFKRDINLFLKDCRDYCSFSDDRTDERVFLFIQTYQQYIDMSSGSIYFTEKEFSQSPESKDIANFIEYVSKYNNRHFLTFKYIFYGYILSQFIGNNSDLAMNPKLTSLTVYVDSNFLLRLLDLQAPPYTITSTELFMLMKNTKMRINVLPETISEVRRVLNKNYTRFARNRPVLIDLHKANINQ